MMAFLDLWIFYSLWLLCLKMHIRARAQEHGSDLYPVSKYILLKGDLCHVPAVPPGSILGSTGPNVSCIQVPLKFVS